MLERRQQRHRRQAVGGHPRGQAQERPGRGLGQGQACGIIDLDAPSGQLRRHLAGQVPVRRHQGGGLFLVLEGTAHDQRDDGGFFPGAGALDAGNPRHRRLDVLGVKAWRLEAGRGQGGVDHPRRGRGLCRGAGGVPGFDVAALDAEAGQQLRHAELRMGRLQRCPGFRRCFQVEAGQHYRALRQPGDHRQQVGGGGDGAGGTGGDDRIGGGIFRPRPRLSVEQPVAALGGVQRFFVGQHGGPFLGQHLEKLQRLLPVFGEGVGNQPVEAVECQPLGMDLIHKPGQFEA